MKMDGADGVRDSGQVRVRLVLVWVPMGSVDGLTYDQSVGRVFLITWCHSASHTPSGQTGN